MSVLDKFLTDRRRNFRQSCGAVSSRNKTLYISQTMRGLFVHSAPRIKVKLSFIKEKITFAILLGLHGTAENKSRKQAIKHTFPPSFAASVDLKHIADRNLPADEIFHTEKGLHKSKNFQVQVHVQVANSYRIIRSHTIYHR